MIVLLDKSPAQFPEAVAEMGSNISVGQLLTPLTRYSDAGLSYGIDNGAFSKFKTKSFNALLQRQCKNNARCLFVTAPDVPFSARRTPEVFKHWYPLLRDWKVALVAQDGLEDLDIPWQNLQAIFIGGTTEFKLSRASIEIIKAAKILSKWVHVGRVNTPERFEWCLENDVDSIDGTGISRYTHMRKSMVKDSAPLFAEVRA